MSEGKKSPRSVLERFNEDTQLAIAEKMGKTLSRGQRKRVVDILLEDIINEGIHKVFNVIKMEVLKKEVIFHPLVKEVLDKEQEDLNEREEKKRSRSKSPGRKKDPSKEPKEKKITLSKAKMVSTVCDVIKGHEQGLKDFLERFDDQTLLHMCECVDDLSEVSDDDKSKFKKKDMVKGILDNVHTFGLEHMFSLFTSSELLEFAEELEISIDSTSKDIIIDCIIAQENYEQEDKSNEEVEASKDKPEIKSGITTVDLQTWYNRTELSEWLRNKQCKVSGNKRGLINRIILYLDDVRDWRTMAGVDKPKKGAKRKNPDDEASAEEKPLTKKKKT